MVKKKKKKSVEVAEVSLVPLRPALLNKILTAPIIIAGRTVTVTTKLRGQTQHTWPAMHQGRADLERKALRSGGIISPASPLQG